ncbi:MAG: hypothetical protein A2622_13405 [Bdellovibrionales bacterium RIFCSPHIGHO2_01_FULL_40_29]|nr:MAG: hypothetical protein A2622_13405 [Bdellovibrionales bacterium RIFCSPHIGHO2_01_FULL_40_29]OFZ34307.1 MAG: hypothetical protein A3D17_04545 [Bdellovibrionales bacterium RIFCSPHIGHO2_02_FULL_40_15]
MKKNLILKRLLLSFALTITFAACTPSTDSDISSTPDGETVKSLPDVIQEDPKNPNDESTQEQNAGSVQILLFNGIGTSLSDWKNLEVIIKSMGLTYQLVNSSVLNNMSLSTLKTYGMILIPGGNSNTINNALTKSTKIRVRQAVRDGGVSYLGICAGAFDAVGTDSLSNTTAYYGFAVAQGAYLKHWYPNGNSSLIAAVPKVSFADGSSRYLMWYDGPSTPEWYRGVVARYPGGKPAISQTWTGSGFVIVSGPHPEAPPSWQWDSGKDPDGTDYDIAMKLIRAALYRQPLPVY